MPIPTANINKSQTCIILTRFITRQCDHLGYLCMGNNSSLSLQESWHLPPSSIRLAGQTLSSLARVTAFLLSPPSLSLASQTFHSAKVFFLRIAKNRLGTRLALPHFLPLHSPSTRGTTKRNGVSSSTSTATSLPDAKPSKLQHSQAAWCTAYASTEQHLPGINCNRGRPTVGDQRHCRLKKNDRDRSTFITGNSLCVHSSRVVDSRQIRIPTNQIRAMSAGAHSYRELRARAPQVSRSI